jgi:histidine phosphotransferase ChpT
MQLDLRVLELLSSKLCHDLISPVSAINNGVELIEDIGDEVEVEAMKLIGNSAAHAARRLKLFRVAYGRAGSEENLPMRDMRLIAKQYFVDEKYRLKWDEALELPGLEDARGALKTLINVLIMSEEILAYGGDITLQRLGGDDKIGCVVEVAGRNAMLSAPFREALENKTPVEDLTPRTIQPYITGRFAEHFGILLTSDMPANDVLKLSLEVPPACIRCAP